MPEQPADVLDATLEIGRIASASGSIRERAEALVAPLRRITPFRAVAIALAEPEQRRFVPLLAEGIDKGLVTYSSTVEAAANAARLGVTRPGPPMLIRDWQVAAEQVRSWTRWCAATGITEALTTCLAAADGRRVGVLGLFFDAPGEPAPAAAELIGRLTPTITNAVDPLRAVASTAGMVHGAVAGVVVTRAGAVVPLPGLAAHQLLAPGSRVLQIATARLTGEPAHASFLYPLHRSDGTGSHARVTVMACGAQRPYQLATVVLLSRPGELCGLTRRELEILGLVAEGWPNQRIAAGLAVTPRTVSTHLEHIQLKLGAPTRPAMAGRALSQGLYIPWECTTLAASALVTA